MARGEAMFKKILIANRGEIACRVIRTARQMGIGTVAVFSEADRDALHTRMADEAIPIGPAPSAESYLVIDRLVEACKRTGAQAVHPGYGFVSENPDFCRALEAAKIAFIGPGPDAMAAMGDKIASKRLAKEAKVSTVPGSPDAINDVDEAVAVATDIGFPVMLKASAGGGGKGMRIARSADEVRDGLKATQSEAKSSFGDDRVFIEKFIEQPRHIEIQVLADTHGNTLYLFERECSIQRRHQKVIEEAPSPFLDARTRAAMGAQAVELAKAVNYRSAGTVEFIVDKKRNFYFLEMNTRLQVEHPVTELITGLDLVEWMIRIAAGEELPFTQEELRIQGWAMESRIYAEDPVRGFLPSIGRLTRFRTPEDDRNTRVDTGVFEGGEISMYYDPMVAKLITRGLDRADAIRNMCFGLDSFYLRGIRHNVGFLSAVMNHPRFRAGELSTNFIAEEFADGFNGADLDDNALGRVVAVAAALHRLTAERNRRISGQTSHHVAAVSDDWVVRIDRRNWAVSLTPIEGGFDVVVDGRPHPVIPHRDRDHFWQVGQPLFDGIVDGHRMVVQIDSTGIGYRLQHAGAELDVLILTPRAAALADHMPIKVPPDLSRFLLSPMPGLLVSLSVSPGQSVVPGQELAVVEAMKMLNVLRAEDDGVVATLHAEPGESLMVDQKILEFEQ